MEVGCALQASDIQACPSQVSPHFPIAVMKAVDFLFNAGFMLPCMAGLSSQRQLTTVALVMSPPAKLTYHSSLLISLFFKIPVNKNVCFQTLL